MSAATGAVIQNINLGPFDLIATDTYQNHIPYVALPGQVNAITFRDIDGKILEVLDWKQDPNAPDFSIVVNSTVAYTGLTAVVSVAIDASLVVPPPVQQILTTLIQLIPVLLMFLFLPFTGHAQNGYNQVNGNQSQQGLLLVTDKGVATGVPDTATNKSAVLSANSITRGFLMPRVTASQRMAISTPATGLQVFDTDSSKFFYYNGSAWVSMGGSGGSMGATGITGPTGLQGVTGATGKNGTNGATGYTGPAGATGAAGTNGTNGATGAVGATGPAGATGATGVTGATGLNGNDGTTGPTGADGALNAWGLTGNTGTNSGVNSIGTIDNHSLSFITNNIPRMLIDSNGNVGIGITNSTVALAVAGVDSLGYTTGKESIYIENQYYNGHVGNPYSPGFNCVYSSDTGNHTGGSFATIKIGAQVDEFGDSDAVQLIAGNKDGSVRGAVALLGTNSLFGFGFSAVTNATEFLMDTNSYNFQDGNGDNILTIISQPNNGYIQYIDGNQANGKVLTSDASGNANWQPVTNTAWGLTGNVGTSPIVNYIGTSENIGLVFKIDTSFSGSISNEIQNTSLGYQALYASRFQLDSGSQIGAAQNTAIGYQALMNGVTVLGPGGCVNNTAIGAIALTSNISGVANTAVGVGALYGNIAGGSNVAIGADALNYVEGYSNTAVGSNCFANATVGTANTLIGSNIEPTKGTGLGGLTALVNNSIVFGHNAVVGVSGTVIFGDTSLADWDTTILTPRPLLAGLGTIYPRAKLDIQTNDTSTHGLRISDGTEGANKVLTSDANGVGSWQTPSYNSGIYLPTFTGNANVASVSGDTAQWMQIGNIVTVSGTFTVTPTSIVANPVTTFDISLPVVSTIQRAGMVAGTATNAGIQSQDGEITGNTGTNNAIVTYFALISGSTTWSYQYQYLIR